MAHRYAEKGDIFVMDAFATAHRAEASVVGVAEFLPACAGLLVAAELAALEKTLTQIERPLVGVFGGAKISTKLPLLRRMATLCDTLIVGGGIATPSCWHKAIPSANRLSKAFKKTTRKRYKIQHKTSSCRKRLSSPRNRTPQPEKTSHCPALAQKK